MNPWRALALTASLAARRQRDRWCSTPVTTRPRPAWTPPTATARLPLGDATVGGMDARPPDSGDRDGASGDDRTAPVDRAPAAERCGNGLDDDLDGAIDEDCPCAPG